MKNKKGNVAVIAIIIVIVAITASVITWLVATKTQAPVQQAVVTQPVPVAPTTPIAQTQPTTPVAQPATPAIKDETASWKVYDNAKYSYSIKYPNSFTFSDLSVANPETTSVQSRIDLKIDKNSTISVYVWNKSSSPSSDPQTTKDFQKLLIDGHNALRGRDYGDAYFAETYVDNGSYTYQIEYAGVENATNLDIYTKILSAFKFTK